MENFDFGFCMGLFVGVGVDGAVGLGVGLGVVLSVGVGVSAVSLDDGAGEAADFVDYGAFVRPCCSVVVAAFLWV